jgi:spermidine synthase
LFGDSARIGVVGLGAGTLACYALPGQHWTFYEIDPAVAAIANDPSRFTFLSRCLPKARIVIGDARLTLEREPAASADVLVVDAFSSDSVPMHLLTREAFDGYGRHVGNRGLLLVHISNRYLDLKPVLAAAGAAGGWHTRVLAFEPTVEEETLNYNASIWVAMSRSALTVDQLAGATRGQWHELKPRPGFVAWTDDHASLLPLIQWTN